MLKALLKKQFLETAALLFGRKSGEKRSRAKYVLYAALFLYAMGSIGFMVYLMMSAICEPLVSGGYDWLYFSFAGIFAFALGIFGSVFTVKSQLYEAKDNELLLAMPIKPSALLFARTVGIYMITFVFEAFILVPAEIVYVGVSGGSAPVAGYVIALLLLPFFTMAFSCLLGWLVANISARMKRKSFMTVILSLAFLSLYFYFYSKMQEYLAMLITNAGEIGSVVKTVGYPLYQFGLAAGGSVDALFIFAVITAVLFGAVYALLSHSFIKIALTAQAFSSDSSKTKQKGSNKNLHGAFLESSPDSALLKKEFSRFISSPVYMLNCSLGTLMFIIGATALIIKRGEVTALIDTLSVNMGGLPLALVAGLALCLISSMNDLTAPSISLEGKAIWQVKSLPVTAARLFRAKLRLHMLLTVPPLLICAAAAIFVVRLDPVAALAAVAAAVCYTLLCAYFGLFLNLKLPRLDWSNETLAVKQSASVIIALLANWVFLFVSFGIYLLFGGILGEAGTAAVCALVYFIASVVINAYFKRSGEKILLSL